jgi:hypothetical protein
LMSLSFIRLPPVHELISLDSDCEAQEFLYGRDELTQMKRHRAGVGW